MPLQIGVHPCLLLPKMYLQQSFEVVQLFRMTLNGVYP